MTPRVSMPHADRFGSSQAERAGWGHDSVILSGPFEERVDRRGVPAETRSRHAPLQTGLLHGELGQVPPESTSRPTTLSHRTHHPGSPHTGRRHEARDGAHRSSTASAPRGDAHRSGVPRAGVLRAAVAGLVVPQACDVVVAASSWTFAWSEVRLCLVPAVTALRTVALRVPGTGCTTVRGATSAPAGCCRAAARSRPARRATPSAGRRPGGSCPRPDGPGSG